MFEGKIRSLKQILHNTQRKSFPLKLSEQDATGQDQWKKNFKASTQVTLTLQLKSREYKGKSYHKHWVVIPNSLIDKVGWKEGQDLEAEIKNGKIVISKNDKTRVDLVATKK